jgi:hypothetical protein
LILEREALHALAAIIKNYLRIKGEGPTEEIDPAQYITDNRERSRRH